MTALARPRVLVSTDIGGTDPDDFQSMVHLLLCADDLDIEGLVSSPFGDGRASDIHTVIDAYDEDVARLRRTAPGYPDADHLRRLVKQGAIDSAPPEGFAGSTEGSDWIIERALTADERPLHVLIWGGIDDLAQALHDDPRIEPRLRVHFIGGPNKTWSVDAYDYIEQNHPRISMIESNHSYRGFFLEDSGDSLSPSGFIDAHVRGRGALGALFAEQLPTVKMGDSPTVTDLLGPQNGPEAAGWGGRFVRAWEGRRSRIVHGAERAAEVEALGVVELLVPRPGDYTEAHHADLLVDNRAQGPFPPGVVDGDMIRFRFAPRDIRTMPYQVRSTHPAMDGLEGSVNAVLPDVTRRTVPSCRYRDWWTDDLTPDLAVDGWPGAKTVLDWRVHVMTDFAERLDRALATPHPLPNEG